MSKTLPRDSKENPPEIPAQTEGRKFLSSRKSLRARIALGVTLPLLIALAALSILHYTRERQLLEGQIQRTAQHLGEVTLGSLKHAMLVNNQEMLNKALLDVGQMETIRNIRVIDLQGVIRAASEQDIVGVIEDIDSAGCDECHQYAAVDRPRTTHLTTQSDILRITTPISNEEQCKECHSEETSHLGVLLIDVSLLDMEKTLLQELQLDLFISVSTAILFTVGVYFLIHRLIVHRVETFQQPIAEFAAGGFSARIPSPTSAIDELDKLAQTFNKMADQLEIYTREQEEQGKLRVQIIIEERERIARELHDGFAQVLAYVSTKAMAVRLQLKNNQLRTADAQLKQLEEAASDLYLDIREAILGLKQAGDSEAGLAITLREYSKQFSRLSELPVELAISPMIEHITLPIDTELQLVRIVQEALTNIRKHAVASKAEINMLIEADELVLEICDDGVGFNTNGTLTHKPLHFGLQIMQERSEIIGADFLVESEPGIGTKVKISVPVGNGDVRAGSGS